MDEDTAYQNSVISAYFGRRVSRGDTLRGRAQGAYATISTLAGGLIGIGLLANLSQLTLEARFLGLLATGAWALAAVGFVIAATTSVKVDVPEPDPMKNWADQLLDQVQEEQRCVRRRLIIALVLGATAVVVTVVTLVVAVWQYPSNSARGVLVQLAPAGVDLFVAQCEAPRSDEAIVDIRGLTSNSNFLDVVVAEGPSQGCHVLLPRTSAVGLKLD